MSDSPLVGMPIDLAAGQGRAVLWGMATDDLNVNLVAWPVGEGVDEHVNASRDVLIVVVCGGISLTLDGVDHSVRAGNCLVIPKGVRRALQADLPDTRYLTVHWRRPPLGLGADTPV